MITKIAITPDRFKRLFTYTDSARNAWSDIIEKYKVLYPKAKILLPSYIGWSANEGSGIFDSVKNAGVDFDFYGLGLYLDIDFEHLKEQVLKDKNQLVLLVHYFGFIDVNYKKITTWLMENEVAFVEDCAHAWLSDLIGGRCGRNGLYSFYSLHKMLPVKAGGILVENNPHADNNTEKNVFFDLSYDLYAIYEIRRVNYKYLASKLIDVEGLEVIYKTLEEGICPQTLPVIVKSYDRTRLYHEMNEKGFGMVSLYHTMIRELNNSPFDSASILSRKIINFPIHQDVSTTDMDMMVEQLKQLLDA